MKRLMMLFAAFSLVLAANVQAGHLFTQAATNTPVNLSAGFGVNIPQLSMEGGGPGSSSFINLANDFNSGDILQLTIGAIVRVFDFDSMPAGWSAIGDPSGLILTNSSTTVSDPAIAAFNTGPLPFNFRIDALAGNFTLTGYRIRVANGTLDGTGAGLVNQSQVTPTAPEPGVVALVSLGLVGAAFGVRRRRAKAEAVPA